MSDPRPQHRSVRGETPLRICTLADPKQGALPESEATTALIREALLPWDPKRHGLFPRSFAPTIIALLLVAERMERLAARQQRRWGHWEGPVTRRRRHHLRLLDVRLTPDIMLLGVVPFLPRLG